MARIRLDCLLFGYRRIKIHKDDVDKTASLLLRNKISTSISPDGEFVIRETDSKMVFDLLGRTVDYESTGLLGLYGYWRGIRNKIACIVSLILVILLCYLSSNLVWDVRIIGNTNVSDAQIIAELEKCGFSVGDFWWNVDRSDVETHILSHFDKISWININRRGSVAYVEIIEDLETDSEENSFSTYTNIVASEDCIIEELTVFSGVAAVKVGEVVKKGDLLISGVLPLEVGGGYCRANGEVKGRVADRVVVEIPRNTVVKNFKGKDLSCIRFNFFDFSLNILKKYGNLPSECDIIEEIDSFSLLGKRNIPFSVCKEYVREYEITDKTYSDSEIAIIASNRLNSLLHSRLVDADLVKIKTSGAFTKTGYKLYSDFVFCADVGAELDYEIE